MEPCKHPLLTSRLFRDELLAWRWIASCMYCSAHLGHGVDQVAALTMAEKVRDGVDLKASAPDDSG